MKVSIIIPVYNVEKYIVPCIESVIQLTCFSDIEVILVDDGSTDQSGVICDGFLEKYKNINVVHQQNGGLSDARNTGLQRAQGDYVVFLDSDDLINPLAFETAMGLLDQHCDVLIYDWEMVSEDGKQILQRQTHVGLEPGVYSPGDFVSNQIRSTRYYWTIACQGFYRRKLLMERKLFFEKGIYHEDDLWFPHMVLAAETICYAALPVYRYRVREGSITQDSHRNDRKHMLDIVGIYNSLYTFFDCQCQDFLLRSLMKKDISKRYLQAIYRFQAYRFEDCCKKINKREILRNSFLLDKIRAIVLIMSDKGYYLTMNCIARIKK